MINFLSYALGLKTVII